MRSRLNWIQNWEELAAKTGYSTPRLAEACGVTVRQLERYFQETKGVLPHQWLKEIRQEKALKLLRSGYLVKEAADVLGYSYPTNLSRDFKQFYGLPAGLIAETAQRFRDQRSRM